ncbi:MAG: DUF3047 domain-containing protein [Geobacter sp.]|nr:DUF3047 domain-containing protein [Geobacter sp.]
MKTFCFCVMLLLALPVTSFSGELVVGKFSASDLSGWTDEIFKGKTSYAIVTENNRTVLKAHSDKAASGLIRKVKLDPREYPILRWSWKVEHTLKKEDIKIKKGDDFAARVYVVFPKTAFPKLFLWKVRAINYVWSSRMPKDTSAPSPYTKNNMIVAVESGDEKAGQWVMEERNIYEDYRKLFGEEPPKTGAIAIMSDTDDTQDEVTAWYGDITLSDK